LPESVGPLWAGTWLDIRAEWTRLTFRVARRSRVVRIVDLAGEDITAAGFPAVRPGVLHRWWLGLPHGWDSRATAVWVWGGPPKPLHGNGVFVRRSNTSRAAPGRRR
jgi:hypothetical protein